MEAGGGRSDKKYRRLTGFCQDFNQAGDFAESFTVLSLPAISRIAFSILYTCSFEGCLCPEEYCLQRGIK